MTEKTLPFTGDELKNIIENRSTPFHIYDEKAMVKMPVGLKRHLPGTKDSKSILPSRRLPTLF